MQTQYSPIPFAFEASNAVLEAQTESPSPITQALASKMANIRRESRSEGPADRGLATTLNGMTNRPDVRDARLLIIDDEPANIALLEEMLREANYNNIVSTLDPHQALPLFRSFAPDLVLLDLMMPGIDGLGVMDQLHAEFGTGVPVPILMLTADISSQAKRRALMRGAKDFLTKPFDIVELLLRIENLLETRFLHSDLQQQNFGLEERVQERTAELESARQRIAHYANELEEAHFETLERLARAGEFRDDETGQHTQRVGRIAALLANHLGFAPKQVRLIQQAARLHDVGKIGISDLILLKPGRLTEEEMVIMRTHTTIGALLFEGGKSELIQIAERIAASHHERWDGKGYPEGLVGAEIPIEARMLSVADVFDALTHDRPYKSAWPVADAVAEISKQSGTQFDPAVVDAFMKLDHESLI